MSETVTAALIGATGAIVASTMAATAQIIVAYINRRSQKPPEVRRSAPPNDDQNKERRKRQRVAVKAILVVIVIFLLAVGILGFVKLSDELKNGILVAAVTIIAVLILQIRVKEPNDMKKRVGVLLIIIPLGGALLGVGFARARQAIGGTPPLSAPVCITNNFYPSGYKGDAEGENKKGTDPIDLNDQWTEKCHSEATCIKIVYHPPSNKWAGVTWQYPDGNWGDELGRTIVGAKKLVFWVRGEHGGELVSFKVGGNDKKKYKDSVDKSLGPIKLTAEWHPYEIDLSDANTSSVIGAFTWTASAKGNPNGLTFYLEGICFTK